MVDAGDWERLRALLEAVIADSRTAPDLAALERLASRIVRQARKRRRQASASAGGRRLEARERRAELRRSDRLTLSRTAMHRIHDGERIEPNPSAPTALLAGRAATCYVCGAPYREVHTFYHRLCPPCAAFNFARREERVDLTGRYALVTGGRVKIGHATALRLLRWGAHVTVTTRFPADAATRFAAHGDAAAWRDRLSIRGLDLFDLPGVISFAASRVAEGTPLDILVHNAAQTVARPPEFHAHERALERSLSPGQGVAAWLSVLDRHGQPQDLRERHGWTALLHEVPPRELLEVLLINAAAPFLLTAGLRPVLVVSKHTPRFVIHVVGRDGQFAPVQKTTAHPHVNMSKAALNMLTRTSAADLAEDRICLNSVDTGWVTLEGAFSKRQRMEEEGFRPPLDEVDAAARICHPIVRGELGEPMWGRLFRHYQPAEW